MPAMESETEGEVAMGMHPGKEKWRAEDERCWKIAA